MTYMHKKIVFINENNDDKYTYIKPNVIYTTKKDINKSLNHKIE
ncbi:MAG: hypothetical protein Q4Q22_06780 [Methanosphaera sp.]|nr:hypothetical protein [Methanosphaera sp.]